MDCRAVVKRSWPRLLPSILPRMRSTMLSSFRYVRPGRSSTLRQKKNIRKTFEQRKMVFILYGADVLLREREGTGDYSKAASSVTSELLQVLDSEPVAVPGENVVIATTNAPEAFDEAAKRRFKCRVCGSVGLILDQ